MPLVLPPLLIALEAALLALAAYLLMRMAIIWVRPLVAAIVAIIPGGKKLVSAAHWYQNLPKVAKIFLYPAIPVIGVPLAIVKGAKLVEHRVTHALGLYVAGHLRPVAAFLGSLATLQAHIGDELAALAETTWGAFSHLVADTIPAMIEDAFTDFRVTVGDVTHSLGGWIFALERGIDRLTDRVDTLADTVAGIDLGAVTAYIDQSIDRLKTDLLEQIGAATAALSDRIGALADDIEAKLRLGIDNLTSRIDMLFELVAPAALAAAAVAALTSFAPDLFCRNSRAASKSLCGLSEDLADSLILDVALITGLLSITELARACQAITGEVVSAFQALTEP